MPDVDDDDRTAGAENLTSHRMDLTNFTIDSPRSDDDTDDVLHMDFDSITTAEEDLLPSPGTLEEGPLTPTTPTTANDFKLAARTSQIISSYRDYLTEMEDVTAKNEKIAYEMESIRGDLGVPKAGPSSARDMSRARPISIHSLPSIREHDVEFLEEPPRPPRFLHLSPPLLQNRQVKRRLLGAAISVAALTAATLTVYSASSGSNAQNSLQAWDKEAADALEEEAEEVLRQNALPKARAPAAEVQSKESAAMKMIKEVLEHPDAVVTGSGGNKSAKTGKEDAGKGGSDSKSGKGESPGEPQASSGSKSAKAFSFEAKSKSDKASSVASSKSVKKESSNSVSGDSSKAGKSSSEDAVTLAAADNEEEAPAGNAPSMNSEEVATTTKPPVLSGKDTRTSALHLEEASFLYEAISLEYSPVFFDRDSSWKGSLYHDAADFCATEYADENGKPGVPCLYEVYCPEGPDTIPFGGYRSGTAYAPIVDSNEHWLGFVQLSEGHPCVAYNMLEPAPTPEETQTLMCCRDTS